MDAKPTLWFIITATVLMLSLGLSAQLGPRKPTGDRPDSALDVACTWQALSLGRSIWYRVPHHSGKRLEIRLTSYAYSVDGMGFQVFTPDQAKIWGTNAASGSLGRGKADSAGSSLVLAWVEDAVQGDPYYVYVANANPFPAPYRLCTGEETIPCADESFGRKEEACDRISS